MFNRGASPPGPPYTLTRGAPAPLRSRGSLAALIRDSARPRPQPTRLGSSAAQTRGVWSREPNEKLNDYESPAGAFDSMRPVIIMQAMPIGTPLHGRTFPLCESLNYREWSGYYAVSAYESHAEHEYNAIRNTAALIDVSPLFKYLVTGPDAARLVDRVITRDVSKMAVGQVFYTPWCDEHGKVIDDGTVSRLEEERFRWTAADPSLRWFRQNARRMNVQIEDVSEEIAAAALQRPTTAKLLRAVAKADIDRLKYFRVTSGTIACG